LIFDSDTVETVATET